VPLALAWTEPGNSIGYGALTFLGFEAIGAVPQALSNAGPALAFAGTSTDGTLYLAWKGVTTDRIFYAAVFNVVEAGLAPSEWTPQEFEPQALTLASPALTAEDFTVYAGWSGRSTRRLFYASAANPF
jgi:hypothetical protein